MAEIDQMAMFSRIIERNPFKTEADLAEKLGWSPNTWTAYKRGRQSLKLSQIAEICDVLGVEMGWLLFDHEPETPDQVILAGMGKDAMLMRQTMGLAYDDETSASNDGGYPFERKPASEDAFLRIKKIVLKLHKEIGITLREDILDRIAIRHYDDYKTSGIDPADNEEVDAWFKLLEKRMAREVAAARSAPGTGKRSAS